MPNGPRFQKKLWDLANTCKSGAVHWNEKGDAIVFEFALLKEEFLDQRDIFCKSNKLSSFIRQLNLYGFKKSNSFKKSRKKDIHEFKHPWFVRDREEWLPYVVRNAVSPNIAKKKTVKRSKSTRKKKGKINQENHEPRNVRRRGRPRKSQQENKVLNTDHSYEKKDTCCSRKNETESYSIPSFKNTLSPRKRDLENLLNGCSSLSFGLNSNVNYPNSQSTLFSYAQPKFDEEAKKMEHIPDYSQNFDDFTSYLDRKQAYENFNDTYSGPVSKNVFTTTPFRVLQSLENIPSISSGTVPDNMPVKKYIWNGIKLELNSKINDEGYFKPKQHLKAASVEQRPPSSIHPAKSPYVMEATVDENQHVKLAINDSHLQNVHKGTFNVISNNENKIEWPNSPTKNFTLTGDMVNLNYVYPTNVMASNAAESSSPFLANNSACYVTEEFLDLRDAYFRHYPERRPAIDGPDLRIY